MAIRTLRLVSTAVALAGLAALCLLALRTKAPQVRIADLTATTNHAYVRVAGTCVDVPTYDAGSGYLGFWIDDGSGRLHVSAYREETAQIVARESVPALGDRIEVAGTIRVRDGLPWLVVGAPEEFEVIRPEVTDCDVAAIDSLDDFERVRIVGQVREVREPYDGLVVFTVHDGSGAIPVALRRDATEAASARMPCSAGDVVEVEGAVSRYRGSPQLTVASADDLRPVEEPVYVAAVRPIGHLKVADSAELVSVRGTVIERIDFSAGARLVLDDGTGAVAVILWQSLLGQLTQAALVTGTALHVTGEVALYQGNLEVVPQIRQDVRVLDFAEVAPMETHATLTSTPSGNLDGSAASTVERAPTVEMRPTETWAVTAVPQVVATPGSPAAAAAPTDRATAPYETRQPLAIGTITHEMAGEWVTVEARVVGTASFSAGFKFTLEDGTGRVVLVLWHDVYDACPDRAGINVGALVRARGQIAFYEDELQLQPGMGDDVTALEPAAAAAPLRPIGSLTGGDVGSRVMIEGRVVRVEGISSAAKVFVADDSGETLVFVWRNVLDRVATNTGLGTPGSRVRVVGTVSVYQSNLEVVPPLPADVVVLSVPE